MKLKWEIPEDGHWGCGVPKFRLEWESKPTEVRAIANLREGWRKLSNTYGFCEQDCSLEPPGDWKLRVQLKIHAWPNRRGRWRDEFPEVTDLQGNCHPFRYLLSRQQLRVWIDIHSAARMVLPHSVNQGFYKGPFCLLRYKGAGFYLHLLVVFRRPGPIRRGDTYERDVQFWQGGLPSLGRR